jgi:predicted transcriptional regulator
MELQITPELEVKLAQSAARQGRKPGDVVEEALAQYLEEEDRLIEAVKRGEESFAHGEFLTHEQVGQQLERFLKR